MVLNTCVPVVDSSGFIPLTITNSDGSVIIPVDVFPNGGIIVLADIEHTNSNGETETLPALIGFQSDQCDVFENVVIRNSNNSWNVTAGSGQGIIVPDSQVREVDGSFSDVPATEAHVCQWFDITIQNSAKEPLSVIAAFTNLPVTIDDITITKIDGSTEDVPAGQDYQCEFLRIDLMNSNNDLVQSINGFPVGGKFPLADVTITEINGDETQLPAGRDHVCQWTPIAIINSEETVLDLINAFPASEKHQLSDVEHTDSDGELVSLPAGVPMVCTAGVGNVETVFRRINFREPFYASEYSRDYPDLWSQGVFNFYEREDPVKTMKLLDRFTLHPDNPNFMGNFSRYISTDGTPSDPGAATFNGGYGSGVPNLVIDTYHGIMFVDIPQITNVSPNSSYGLFQNWLDSNDPTIEALRWNRQDWIIPTREMITNVCFPDNNTPCHNSPNPIIDSGTRRYLTCERYTDSGPYGFAVYMLGSEIAQSTTSTISGQNRVIVMRFLQAADILELTS